MACDCKKMKDCEECKKEKHNKGLTEKTTKAKETKDVQVLILKEREGVYCV